jgi:ribonuclease HI
VDDSCIGKSHRLVAFIDGASRGNPGESAFAVVLGNEQGEVLYQIAGRIGTATNNEAEYRALLEALDLVTRLGIQHLTVFSDSQLLVNQINGTYRVSAPKLLPLYQEAKSKIRRFQGFALIHIDREKNSLADRLASEILHRRISYNFREGRSGNRRGTSSEESPSSTEQGTG